MEECQAVAQRKATQEELDQHLAQLNKWYQKFGDIQDGLISFRDRQAYQSAYAQAEENYLKAERWLLARGYPLFRLDYDQPSRSYRFRSEPV